MTIVDLVLYTAFSVVTTVVNLVLYIPRIILGSFGIVI